MAVQQFEAESRSGGRFVTSIEVDARGQPVNIPAGVHVLYRVGGDPYSAGPGYIATAQGRVVSFSSGEGQRAWSEAGQAFAAREAAPRSAEREAAITGVERVKTGTGLAAGEERVIDSVVYRGTATGQAIPIRRTDVTPSAVPVPGGPRGLELAPGAFFTTAAGEVYGYEGLQVASVAAAKRAEPMDAYAGMVWTPELGFQSSKYAPRGFSTREFTPQAGSKDWFKGLFHPLAWTIEQKQTKMFAAGLSTDVSEFQQRSEVIKTRAAMESAVFEVQKAGYRTDVTGFKEKYAPFLVSVDGQETYLFPEESGLLSQARAEQAVLEYRGQELQARAITLRTAYAPVFAGLGVEARQLQARADYLNVSNQAMADLVAGTNVAIAAKSAQALGVPLMREELPRTRTVTVWTDEGIQYFEVDAPEIAQEKYRLSHPVSSRFFPAPSAGEGAVVWGARTAWAWSPPGILEAGFVGAGAVFGGAARTAYGVVAGEIPLGQAIAAETPEIKASREYFGEQAFLLGAVTTFQVAGPAVAAFAPNVARVGTVWLGKVSQRLPAARFTMPAVGAGAVQGVVSFPELAVSPQKYVAGVAGAALGGASWGALSAFKYGEVASGKQARVISEGMPGVKETALWKGSYYEGKTGAVPIIGFMGRKLTIGTPQRVVLGGDFPLGKKTISTIEARFYERAVRPVELTPGPYRGVAPYSLGKTVVGRSILKPSVVTMPLAKPAALGKPPAVTYKPFTAFDPLRVETGETLAASGFLRTTRQYAEAVRFAKPKAGYPQKLKVALDASRATVAENLALQEVTTGEIQRSAQAIPRITRTRSQWYGSGTIKQWMMEPPKALTIHDIDVQNVFGAENLAQRYVRGLTMKTPKTWYGTEPGTFQVIKRVGGAEAVKLVDIHPIGGADVYQPRQASLGFETQLPVSLKADKALVMAAGESAARKGVLSAVAIRPGGVVGPLPERLKDLAWRMPIFKSLKFDVKQYASARNLLTELERLYPAEALAPGGGVAASRAAVISPSILIPASAVSASLRVSEASVLPSLPSLPSFSMALSPSLVSPSFVSPFLGPSFAPSVSPSISAYFSPLISPSVSASFAPSVSPSLSTYVSPSFYPSISPSISPYISPSFSPSVSPSFSPSDLPGFTPEYFLLGGLASFGAGGFMPRSLFKGVKQLTRYMPDLTSFVFDIRGKMPDIELFTGAELRPLLW